MTEQRTTPQGHTSSTGHAMATGDWLDAHFEACRPEYEAILRRVGFRLGWHVLDAGCGTGAFLPLLAELVGPTGSLAAVDLAPENVAAVAARLRDRPLPCRVECRVGGLDPLPYPDGAFDGVWCANVTQYLTDEELDRVVAEFRRVVRPGGLVAIKDSDIALTRFTTRDPRRFSQLLLAAYEHGPTQVRAAWRGPTLPTWLARAGLVEVRAQTTLIERYAPHRPVERRFMADYYRTMAAGAALNRLPDEAASEWAWLGAHADAWVAAPDHYFREGNVLAVGRVPDAG